MPQELHHVILPQAEAEASDNIKISADSNGTKKLPIDDTTEDTEETLCSICATPIVDYIQKYCLGEPYSPACDKCDDQSWISDDNTPEDETNLEDAKTPALQCLEDDIEEKFEEFLRNFTGG